MSEHRLLQPLTGSEQPQRSATLVRSLTGASVALWLIPIALCFTALPRHVIVLAGILIGAAAVCSFVTAQWLRAQHRHEAWRLRVEEVAQRRHNDLAVQMASDSAALRKMVTTHIGDLRVRVDQVAGKLDRSSWDIYADAITDSYGGPEVVNGQETRRLHGNDTHSNVVSFPRTPGGH